MTIPAPKITTIGTFDGVHIGHKKILEQLVDLGHKHQLEPTVLTLFPHPRMVLEKHSDIKLINTIEERIGILKSYGIQNVVVKEFNSAFANLLPEDYVKNILVNELNTKEIIIGYDHHFGKNRSANITDLKVFSEVYNFKVQEIPAQDIEAVTVSSTKIRNALILGKVDLAKSYLGYHFFLNGIVTKGKGIGKTIGFPTANITIKEDYKLIPKHGVYIVKVHIDDNAFFGMMNIGTNPTVNGKMTSLEVHLFNFSAPIYHHNIRVSFLKRLRDEQKFNSLSALTEQLHKDMAMAKSYISTLS